MSLPQHLTRDVASTVYIDLLTRPTTVTVDVVMGDGSTLVSAASATVSTITTTITAAATRGATMVAVNSNTGISVGSTFWLADDPEDVLVQKIATKDIYLRRPLLRDHVSGATVAGTRCSYQVAAAKLGTVFFDGRVKWTVDGVPYFSACECTAYPMRRTATPQQLFDRHPKLYEVLDPEVDTARLLDLGFEACLSRIGVKGRARVFTAGPEFETATVLAALMIHYEHSAVDEGAVLFQRYQQALTDELERLMETTPRDENQDGIVSAGEQISMRTVELRR